MKRSNKKLLGMITGVILCVGGIAGGLLVYAQNYTQKSVLNDSLHALETNSYVEQATDYTKKLYKDSKYVDENIKKQVCDKYGLDYNTVKFIEITGEISNYETALSFLETEAEESMEYLTVQISEIFAFDGGEKIVKNVCKAAGLVYEKAQIKELSIEQLMDIQKQAFETSDHDDYRYNQLIPEKIKKEVCKKYHLDYNTVRNAELTEEMKYYETALVIKEQSLSKAEVVQTLNQMFNTIEAERAVIEVCEANNLRYKTVKAKSFTVDQLMEMQKKVAEILKED